MQGKIYANVSTVLLVAVFAVGGTAYLGGNLGTGIEREGTAKQRALDLLAEVAELCRSRGATEGHSSSLAESVRRAVAREAVAMAREQMSWIRHRDARVEMLGAIDQAERSCAEGSSQRSLSDTRRSVALTGDDLARLNEAASREIELNQAKPVHTMRSTRDGGGAVSPAEEPAEPEQVQEAEPRIAMRFGSTGSSSRHPGRVERYLSAFNVEALALRSDRRDLQRAIKSESLAASVPECRAFGMTLERAHARLGGRAPVHGLALRIARMLRNYRRGVELCLAGRPSAAYAFLSEGDREWALVAQNASRGFGAGAVASFAAASR